MNEMIGGEAAVTVPTEMAEQAQKPRGVPLVMVLYSSHGDVYKIPSASLDLWLSVQVDMERHPGAAIQTADGKGWRRAYCALHVIYAGRSVAVAADDPLVVDYLQQIATGTSSPQSLFAAAGERGLKV